MTLDELLRSRVAAAPDAVAVTDGSRVLTYGGLDRAASGLATVLAGCGAGPERVVAVVLERSASFVVAMTGAVLAGAAYLPVDPGYPAERVRAMLAAARPVCVVTSRALAGSVPCGEVPVVLIDDPGPLPARERAVAGVVPASAAYVMFTSGSTGVPKGVVVPYAAVDRLVRSNGFAELVPGDVVALASSVSFDAATFEIWGALATGATVTVPPPGVLSLAELRDFLARQGVSVLWLTAGLFHEVVDADVSALAGLRLLLAGGDALSPAHCAVVLDQLPDVRLINGYGPTENTTFTTTHPISVAQDVLIGSPVSGTRVLVLDDYLQPVPPGAVGELYTAGLGLARGYANQPALTGERFVACPYAGAGERMYRTGDLARWTSDGVLEFAGRSDDQVKIRGFRVEPGDLQAVLAAHPAVAQAYVTTRTDPQAGRQLIAYLTPAHPGQDADLEVVLRDYAASHLPPYLTASHIVTIAQFPLTPNGKVDRARLPEPSSAITAATPDAEPPSGFEDAMCAAFAQTLGLERVGRDDNFFALGGHSLLAMRLVERLRALGLAVAVRTVIEAPTVSKLIERASLSSMQDALGMVLPIRPAGRGAGEPDRPPIFCVHPIGGLSWCYLPLARYVPEDYPIYGLQAAGLRGTGDLPVSLSDMAAQYAERLRAVQPHGPYHLLGWSFGGITAHEIAAQLQAAGEKVATLVILDSYPPDPSLAPAAETASVETDLATVMATMRSEQGHSLSGVSDAELEILASIYLNNLRILRAHRFPRFDGNLLVVSAEHGKDAGIPLHRWQPFVTGEISEVRLPCAHAELSRPDLLEQAWTGIEPWFKN